MCASVLAEGAPAAASRLLADVTAFGEGDPREPALERLEAAIGRDFADRLVAALSHTSVGRVSGRDD